jgi:hypothetical protein
MGIGRPTCGPCIGIVLVERRRLLRGTDIGTTSEGSWSRLGDDIRADR